MKEFDAYLAAYNARRIELVAVWTPVNTDAPLGAADTDVSRRRGGGTSSGSSGG